MELKRLGNMMMRKKRSRARPFGLGAAALGGMALALGYRLWVRRNASGQDLPGPIGPTDIQPEVDQLAGKWHSLDAETGSGHIPKDLERAPKNLEQSLHPEA